MLIFRLHFPMCVCILFRPTVFLICCIHCMNDDYYNYEMSVTAKTGTLSLQHPLPLFAPSIIIIIIVIIIPG